jgi:hypothetical protein
MFAATAGLRPAYEATAYAVRWRGRDVVLRIAARPPSLPWGVCRQAWFITASNPFSRLCPAPANRRAGRRLAEALRRRGVRSLPAVARGEDGDWPAEPGLLVFGLNRRSAAALGRGLRQNAILQVFQRGVMMIPLA